MPDDDASAGPAGAAPVAAGGFIARRPCPACGFPIGIRAADRKHALVRCPVCGARATMRVEEATADGPFRAAETLALVPTAPASMARQSASVFHLSRPSAYARAVWIGALGYGALLLMTYLAGLSPPFVVPPAILTLVFLLTRPKEERGQLDGRELVRSRSRPFSGEARIRLPGAVIRVERRGAEEAHVVVVEQQGEQLVIGATVSLASDEAEAIADRLRVLAARDHD